MKQGAEFYQDSSSSQPWERAIVGLNAGPLWITPHGTSLNLYASGPKRLRPKRLQVKEMSSDHYLSIARARERLGFSPRFSVSQALDATFDGGGFSSETQRSEKI